MTVVAYLVKLAVAADSNVVGLAVVANGAVVSSPSSVIVTRAGGAKVRIDSSSESGPTQAAQNAVINADISPATIAAADDAERQNRADVRSMAAAFISDINDYLLIADTANATQVRTAVKRLAQAIKVIIPRLVEID